MPITQYLPGRTIWLDGSERLYFSGTSYLGIGHNEAFRELLQEGIERYGTVYSSSRASNVQLSVYDEAEHLLASLTGADAALTFSSGFQAGQAVVQRLLDRKTVLYAPGTHPAVWRSATDAVHGNFASWAATITEQVLATSGDVAIITNSLDPLLAQRHSFDWVTHLPEDRNITLLVDDSHGLGIIGAKGSGIFPSLRSLAKSTTVVMVVSSLGKAFGVPGGVVLGPTAYITDLKKSPFFTAGSPAPPAYFYALLRAQSLYQQAREQLFENVAYFQEQTSPLSIFRSIDQYPVFYTEDHSLATAIAPSCILSSFPYPYPDSEPITRAIVSSLHRSEDLETLATLVRRHKEE